jgi:hypothetical protein
MKRVFAGRICPSAPIYLLSGDKNALFLTSSKMFQKLQRPPVATVQY